MQTVREPNPKTKTAKLLAFVKERPRVTATEAGKVTGIGQTTAASLLHQMSQSGRIKRVSLSEEERKKLGEAAKYVYEIGDESKPTALRRAEKAERKPMKRSSSKLNDIINSQPSKLNGRLVLTPQDAARALAERVKEQEAQEDAGAEPRVSPSVDPSEALAAPQKPSDDTNQRMVERAKILVRAGAGNQINETEWGILSNVTGKTPAELMLQWQADPTIQERFTVTTPLEPLPEVPRLQLDRVEVGPISHLVKMLSTALLNEVIAQLNEGIQEHVTAVARQLVQTQRPTPDPLTPPVQDMQAPSSEELRQRVEDGVQQETKPKLKSVLVMGLMPVQAGEITKTFHDCFDLRFWWPEEGMDLLKDNARRADIVVAHVRHLAHAHTELVKSVGKSFVTVKGGVGQLKEKLTELYVTETQ